MIVVDASVWIDLLRDRTTPEVERLLALIDNEVIAVADLALTEVLQGVRRDLAKAERLLLSLPTIEVGGRDAALRAAQNFRSLRARGITVRGTVDTLIATCCIEHGHSLLFSDRNFEPFVDHLGLRSALIG